LAGLLGQECLPVRTMRAPRIYANLELGSEAEADRLRLKRIQIALDQYWDYLHQRRALGAADRDPNEAQVRGATTIERYVR
jgi:hypothetical protein